MKIAHIAPAWIPIPPENYGGGEIALYNLLEAQVALGHDVTLFAPADAKTSAKVVSFFPRSLRNEGVPLEACLKVYYHFHKSIEHIKGHHFDMLHIHLCCPQDMLLLPLTASLATPVIATVHSPFPFDWIQTWQGTKWIGDADQYYAEWFPSVPIVAISQTAARGLDPYPLHIAGIVHHGLPMHIFKPIVEQPEDFLVWLGHITPEKGVHLAIQAARAANIPLVLAGVIDHHFAGPSLYFEEMIKPHIDQQQVRYIGPVNMKQKIDLLSRARGMLNPIQWEEPFGLVMIEAMSVGCPVIAVARGAAPEIIAHGTSGFLVQDVQEMIEYIGRLDQLDRRNVRAHAEQNFASRTMAEKYLEIYQQPRLQRN